MAWPYEVSKVIIDAYKHEFLLKGRASEFDVADCEAILNKAYELRPDRRCLHNTLFRSGIHNALWYCNVCDQNFDVTLRPQQQEKETK